MGYQVSEDLSARNCDTLKHDVCVYVCVRIHCKQDM